MSASIALVILRIIELKVPVIIRIILAALAARPQDRLARFLVGFAALFAVGHFLCAGVLTLAGLAAPSIAFLDGAVVSW